MMMPVMEISSWIHKRVKLISLWQDKPEFLHPRPATWDLSYTAPHLLPGEPRSGTSCGLG